MQLAFKINAFAGRENALEYAICEISNAGFKNIGLVFDRPYLWLEQTAPQVITCISRMLTRRNLRVASVSSCTASGYARDKKDLTPPGQRFGPSFGSKDSAERQLRVEHTKKVIDFACALGCLYVDISTGYQPQDLDFATTWRLTKECLEVVCSYTWKKGVFINIEYEPGTFGQGGLFVGSALSALAMCNDIGSLSLGINLDLIHAAVCGEDIPAMIRLLGSSLHIVEFDDMRSMRDKRGILRRKHEHLIPGDGELAVQYPAIFEALEEIGYNGPIIVELYNHFDKNPEEACRKSYQYLMDNFGGYFRD
ncbi:MAG: hypothetical protein G01um101448_918 [Parcubacteria group bacterium Gr01-1014_48]|nr:MAG: hypothetical protein Greene041614_782 [Parcubacteria group bacterium Greene0416_14]TSC72800.1 MAG: hypothetical protein G01um101448_918 [Parcubacteria group bacterium Gr01-1014_48]TSD00912.1 MAG: hypothetical protein Greene101415_626 [Parcubacteria group bacterium Greene1014_15]TSD07994.1 MAG: hypothetical protein Greene07144_535 [Parcubacteria group bacterium Greene0714_4]